MKFLCDQCKAKYQIADEKVVGRTVRMKCRKCGHMIEVRAAVTETSVSVDIPRDEISEMKSAGPTPQGGTPAAAPRPAAQNPPPRPGGGLATSLSAAPRPGAPRPPQRSEGGLANAFTKSVEKHEDLELLELHAGDEWYVAINGVPVGPVRIAELRRKAAAGAVTEDSLVWQEGLEEWRPVRAVSELAVVVREAIAGGRAPLTAPATPSAPPAPPARSGIGSQPGATSQPALGGSGSLPGTAAQRPMTASGALQPRAPAGSSPSAPHHPAAARSNVVPFSRGSAPALARAERLDEHADLDVLMGSSPAPANAPIPTPAERVSPGSIAPDPFAAPPAADVQASPFHPPLGASPVAAPAAAPVVEAAPVHKRNVPWMAIAMVVLAGAFGVTAAIIMLTRPPQQQPVVINIPSAQSPAPTTAPVDMDLPPPEPVAATDTATPATSKPVAVRGPGPKPATPAGGQAATPAPTNAAIAALLGNGTGPAPGGPSPGGGGGGGQLTGDQIQRVVRNYQIGVRRSCFDRLATDKTGTVQVTVDMTVNGSGQVTSSSADGNDPAIAKCIEGAVRNWQFPATGDTSKIRIPFKFVKQ